MSEDILAWWKGWKGEVLHVWLCLNLNRVWIVLYTYIHTYIQTDRQAGRQTDRHTCIHIYIYTHTTESCQWSAGCFFFNWVAPAPFVSQWTIATDGDFLVPHLQSHPSIRLSALFPIFPMYVIHVRHCSDTTTVDGRNPASSWISLDGWDMLKPTSNLGINHRFQLQDFATIHSIINIHTPFGPDSRKAPPTQMPMAKSWELFISRLLRIRKFLELEPTRWV